MLSTALREQTKTAHQELEKIFVRRIRALASINDYSVMLEVLYGFYHPLEQMIDPFITNDLMPDKNRRRKSQNLIQDINTLTPAGSTGTILEASSLPSINCQAEAFGALYVLEGSTLGGAIICKMIGEKLGLSDNRGLSYFYSYGDEIPSMWQKFRQIIDVAVPPGDQDITILAANDTFNELKNWMQHAK